MLLRHATQCCVLVCKKLNMKSEMDLYDVGSSPRSTGPNRIRRCRTRRHRQMCLMSIEWSGSRNKICNMKANNPLGSDSGNATQYCMIECLQEKVAVMMITVMMDHGTGHTLTSRDPGRTLTTNLNTLVRNSNGTVPRSVIPGTDPSCSCSWKKH